jgi:hypothetical protein
MIAVVCEWGADLSVGPTGDISVAPVQTEVQKRIVRRLLTNPGDYIWHMDYGAGLGTYVGEPFSSKSIENVILDQIRHEALIAATPSPVVQILGSLAGSLSTRSVSIRYQINDTSTGDSIVVGLGT